MIPELFKQCACAPAKWAKCDHPFHFRKMVHKRRWTISLDAWLGHARVRSVGAAEAVAADLITALKAGTFSPLGPSRVNGHGAVIPQGSASGQTFASVAATFLQGVVDDPERKPRYRANLRSLIAVITGWRIPDRPETLGALPIGAVDTAVLERFYRAQVAAGRSVSHRNKMIQFLRGFSRWAVRQGYCARPWLAPDDPDVTVKRRTCARRARRLALPLVDAEGRVLVAGEYERLIAVAESRLRDLCVATMETGARLAELVTLVWRDVDLPRGTVTIWDSKDPARVKKRGLPISDTLRAVLTRRQVGPDGEGLPPAAAIFGNAVGEPVRWITWAWENAVLRAHGHAGTRDRTTRRLTDAQRAAYHAIDLVFHDLRHEAASLWHEAGITLPTISYLLGHTSLETTAIYLNLRPDGLAATMAAFERARTQAASGKSGVPVAYTSESRPARVVTLTPRKSRKAKQNLALA